ncbi:MAG: type II toxin-antitoxin system RelE/ParE family toxin, partial [Dehalococcoidia bacterium]
MEWGEIELHPEVESWPLSLDRQTAAHVARYIDLLTERGPLLDEPYTRQLREKVRELRFRIEGEHWRITYWIASGRRIVLLTVFRKTARQERSEIDRAEREMYRCIDEQH